MRACVEKVDVLGWNKSNAADNFAVNVSGDGDDIIDVIWHWRLAIWEEEGLEFGALGRVESCD